MVAGHRQEHTGDALLDRIQANVMRLVKAVQGLAADAEARRVVSLRLAKDFTTTATTAQETKLKFAVAKGDIWDVEVWAYGSDANIAGMAYAIGCPAGSVLYGELESSSSSNAVANWTTQAMAANTLSPWTHVGASNVGRPDRINVRVDCGAAGFIVLQGASSTAGAVATISRAYMRATRVVSV